MLNNNFETHDLTEIDMKLLVVLSLLLAVLGTILHDIELWLKLMSFITSIIASSFVIITNRKKYFKAVVEMIGEVKNFINKKINGKSK